MLSFNRQCPVSSQITAEMKKKIERLSSAWLVKWNQDLPALPSLLSPWYTHRLSSLMETLWGDQENPPPSRGEVYERQRAEKDGSAADSEEDEPSSELTPDRSQGWAAAAGGRVWQHCRTSQCHLAQITCSLMDNLFSVVFSPTQNLTADSGYRRF